MKVKEFIDKLKSKNNIYSDRLIEDAYKVNLINKDEKKILEKYVEQDNTLSKMETDENDNIISDLIFKMVIDEIKMIKLLKLVCCEPKHQQLSNELFEYLNINILNISFIKKKKKLFLKSIEEGKITDIKDILNKDIFNYENILFGPHKWNLLDVNLLCEKNIINAIQKQEIIDCKLTESCKEKLFIEYLYKNILSSLTPFKLFKRLYFLFLQAKLYNGIIYLYEIMNSMQIPFF